MIASAFGVLFDGFAYGMLLFLLSVGLSVTLGMMNFVNLAHCSFAMLGGYVTVTLMNDLGWPFLATLPVAFVAAAVVSVAFERALYRRLYRASDLDQCLLTIGIVFVSVAVAAYVYGTIQQPVNVPVLSARHGLGHGPELRRLPAVPDRRFARGHARCWSRRSNTPASARRCAPRSTTSAWRADSASMSIASSPSPSRSAAVLPASAARSPIEIVGLDPPSPSPTWSMC